MCLLCMFIIIFTWTEVRSRERKKKVVSPHNDIIYMFGISLLILISLSLSILYEGNGEYK